MRENICAIMQSVLNWPEFCRWIISFSLEFREGLVMCCYGENSEIFSLNFWSIKTFLKACGIIIFLQNFFLHFWTILFMCKLTLLESMEIYHISTNRESNLQINYTAALNHNVTLLDISTLKVYFIVYTYISKCSIDRVST